MRPSATSPFNLARVVGDAGGVIWRRWPSQILLAALFVWAPHIVARSLALPSVIVPETTPTEWLVSLAEPLAFLVLRTIGWATITSITLAELEHHRKPIGEALQSGARATPTLLPFLLVGASMQFAEPFLVVVPDPILRVVMAFVANISALVVFAVFGGTAAVVVSERRSMVATALRSYRLMGEARWILVAAYLALRIITTGSEALAISSIGPGNCLNCRLTPAFPIHAVDLIELIGLLLNTVWTVFEVSAYRELRRLQDGVAPSDVAAIFD